MSLHPQAYAFKIPTSHFAWWFKHMMSCYRNQLSQKGVRGMTDLARKPSFADRRESQSELLILQPNALMLIVKHFEALRNGQYCWAWAGHGACASLAIKIHSSEGS